MDGGEDARAPGGGPGRKTRPAIRVARRTRLCRTEATPLTCVIAQVQVKCPACTTLLALPQGTTKFAEIWAVVLPLRLHPWPHSDGLPVGDDGDGIGCSSTAHASRLAAAPRGIRPWADEGRPARTVDVQLLQKS